MSLLFAFLSGSLSGILEESVLTDMNIIAHHRADLAENYIDGRCDFLNGYARSTEAINVLSDPENPEYIKAAGDYTNRYAAGYDNIEGLYIASWDTYVLAYTNPDSMDKTFRDADSAKELEVQIRTRGEAFCTGIVQAPVTVASEENGLLKDSYVMTDKIVTVNKAYANQRIEEICVERLLSVYASEEQERANCRLERELASWSSENRLW